MRKRIAAKCLAWSAAMVFSGSVAAFDSEISNLIERRTLLLPQGSVGQLVGGERLGCVLDRPLILRQVEFHTRRPDPVPEASPWR